MPERRVDPWAAAVVLAVVGVTAAWLGTQWALDTADGVSFVLTDDGSHVVSAEFITGWIYWLAALAAMGAVAAAATYRWPVAAASLGGVVLGLAWGATECASRYRSSGVDGRPLGVYAVPFAAALVGGLVVLLVARRIRPR
jgi:hypothetical protein